MYQPQKGNKKSRSSQETVSDFGIQLFRIAGHTFSSESHIANRDIKTFVYSDIQHRQVLTVNDWCSLNRVVSAALLFSNGKEYFDIPNCDEKIDYYAISLCTKDCDRSPLAVEVHRVLSRISQANLSIVLFEANDFYMFSFAERKQNQSITVILSDWFSCHEITETDVLHRIDAASFSNESVKDFFNDFLYSMARKYYLYPSIPSIDYYENSRDDKIQEKYAYRCRKMMASRSANGEKDYYLDAMLEYEDDFVLEEHTGQENWLSTDDIELDLIEVEINNSDANGESDSINDNVEISTDSISKEDMEYIRNLDSDVFNDPIKLLKWIEKHST